MEDILVPLGFFTLVFGFPLVRRELIHRHTMEKLRFSQAEGAETPAIGPSAAEDETSLALRLPEPHRLYALALLCRLQDAQTANLDTRTAFLIRQARQDYLPATLKAYLNVSPAARERLHQQGHNPESMLQEQLEIISRGVQEALRQDHQAAQNVLTQGAFLREIFQAPAQAEHVLR